ncbi:MAG TPA: MG2 domain-containing protein, partial [Pyrinomonadaceae bacterium]
VKRLAAAAPKGRWLAVRAVGAGGETREALPGDTPVTVTVGAGTPSAEGPRRTTAPQSFQFKTYGPLRVTKHQCGWSVKCSPFDQWVITFSNPLDREAFDPAQVKIEPDVPGADVNVYGTTMYIQGSKRGRTTYRVTLAPTLRDEFGQTLGRPVTLGFDVGAAEPSLFSQGGSFVVLDPAGGPHFSVFSVNHPALKVSLYAVTPQDYDRFVTHMRQAAGYYDEKRTKAVGPPGALVSTRTVEVKVRPDEVTETRLDLRPALKGGFGNVFVVVEPVTRLREREVLRSWVQFTGIGLDAFADREELVGWATALADGRPLEGVELTLLPAGARAATGRDGLARLPLPAKASDLSGMLLARRGDDTAFLPEWGDWWYGTSNWARRESPDELRWYVFDDRKMYRPGEEVSLKGWLRRVGTGKAGDVGALGGAAGGVNYMLRDSRGNEVLKGAARINALGGFDTKFKIPPTMNLGGSYVQFDAQGVAGGLTGTQHQHLIQVQEFRRPEFEVSAKADVGPHFVGGHAQATVQASYYAGGGLADSEVNWRVTATPTSYTPPNRGDYTFGRWTPWWGLSVYAPAGVPNAQTFKGKTDAAGRHALRIDFDSVNPPQPSSVVAQASVTDVNRQAWTSNTTLLVHPSDLYVGLRSDRLFVQQGEPLHVQTIVSDLDGRLVAGREVRMRAAPLEWKYTKGEWKQTEGKEAEECVVKSGTEAVRCTFRPKAGGTYRVTARVYDDRERPN